MSSHAVILSRTPSPLSVAEAKAFLRVDGTQDDVLIQRLVERVTDLAEVETGRAFSLQRVRFAERLIRTREVRLPRTPFRALVSVTVKDTSGTIVTIEDAYAELDVLVLPERVTGFLTAEYDAGYAVAGEASEEIFLEPVPPSVLAGLQMAVTTLYENRENYVTGTVVARLPVTASTYFDAVRRREFV